MERSDEPVVEVPCSYHAPFLVHMSDGSRPWCGCGGISVQAAAVEITMLRVKVRELTRET